MKTQIPVSESRESLNEDRIWSFVVGNLTSTSMALLIYGITGRMVISEPGIGALLCGALGLAVSVYIFKQQVRFQ